MPRAVKQVANGAVTRPKTGSMLSRVIPVSEIEDDWLRMVLYGYNRTGKTHLACQFPKPLLLIGYDPGLASGAKTVKLVPGVFLSKVRSTEEAVSLSEELRASPNLYKTHVHDMITSLQDICLKEIMGLEHVPVQLNFGLVSEDQYRERSEKTKEILRLFRDLPANVVFVANERDHNPSRDRSKSKLTRGLQQESFLAADVGGATAKWLHDACDFICRLTVEAEVEKKVTRVPMGKGQFSEETVEEETGRNLRRLRITLTPQYAGGFRSCVPENVPEWIDRPTWDRIEAVIRGERIEGAYYQD